MGSVLSIEFVDGQAATGKTTLIQKEAERSKLLKDRSQYIYLYSDPLESKKPPYFFVRGEDEDPSEWGVCVLDVCQSGITHKYWMELIKTLRNPAHVLKSRLLVDRSPLSHIIYDFLWKRLFPVIKDCCGNTSFDCYDVDMYAGYVIVREAIRRTERGRECLQHFGDMMLSFMSELQEMARKNGIELIIYLSFDNFEESFKHNCADERRKARGGFDQFPDHPVEGSRTEYCQKVYCAGECLLWQELWDVYHLRLQNKSTYFQLLRLSSTDEGHVVDPEGNGDQSFLVGLARDKSLNKNKRRHSV